MKRVVYDIDGTKYQVKSKKEAAIDCFVDQLCHGHEEEEYVHYVSQMLEYNGYKVSSKDKKVIKEKVVKFL